MNLDQNLNADLPRLLDDMKESRENVKEYDTLTNSLDSLLSMLFFRKLENHSDYRSLKWTKEQVDQEVSKLAELKSKKLSTKDYRSYFKMMKALEKLNSIQGRLNHIIDKQEIISKLNQHLPQSKNS